MPPPTPPEPKAAEYLFATTAGQEADERMKAAHEELVRLQDWTLEMQKAILSRHPGSTFPIHWCEVMMQRALSVYNEVGRCNGAALVRGTPRP